MAMTVDGKMAKHENHLPTEWTCPEDKKMFSKLSKEAGVIIMGSKTFFTLPGPLPGRLNVVFTTKKNQAPAAGVKWVRGEPALVLDELEKTGYKEIILGGGAFLNSLFLKKKLINEIILTLEPKIFGQGLSLFNENFNTNLRLIEAIKLNDDTLSLRYEVKY